MKIKYILFDLDGTLLPMEQEEFTKAYFGSIAKTLAPIGYEPKKLVESIWSGTIDMIKNDGAMTNEEVFWNKFCEIYGDQARLDNKYFDDYYKTNFDSVRGSCGYNEMSAKVVAALKNKGYKLALATNPIFPSIATEKRIAWAGLDRNDFELYTTYENSKHCKPNLEYYKDILSSLGATAEECLMVGNDVSEDMVVSELGLKVFLVTDNLINKYNKDISNYTQGSLEDLLEYLNTLN